MRTERPRWLLLVALLLLLAYLIYMTGFPIPRQETATERCERVSTEQVVHDNLVSRANRTGDTSAISKPPSRKDREWYRENCFNGKPMQ